MQPSEITIERLLQTEQFQAHIATLEDPEEFLQTVDWAVNDYKVSQLLKAFPKDLTVDQLVASLLLNLQQDYDTIVTNLPPFFSARESKIWIHPGYSNQIGIHFEGKLRKMDVEDAKRRVATFGVHFRDIDGTQCMYLDSIQGELKEGRHTTVREIRRVYGKLATHFGEDWKVGLLRQAMEHAHAQDMDVRGRVPGIFCLIGSSRPEYPLYSLNYVRTYLSLGIPLEKIEFNPVPDDIPANWDGALSFLQTIDPEEQQQRLGAAARDYARAARQLWSKINITRPNLATYNALWDNAFTQVFEEHLS